MVTVNLHCPRCQSVQVYRHGQNPKDMIDSAAVTVTGYFSSVTVTSPVNRGVKDQIAEMAFNGAGVRYTARTLKIGINTVIRTLKNSRHEE